MPPAGKPSLLFGTMHIRDERVYRLCGPLYNYIKEADCYLGEMDLDADFSKMPSPRYDLRSYLNDKQYQKFAAQIKKSFGLDIAYVAHLHPLVIMNLLSTSVFQIEHLISLDEHLWEYAKEHEKPVRGLESFDDQFNILHSLEVKKLYRQLFKLSKNPSSIRKSTLKSLELYTEGKIHALYKSSRSSMQDLRKKVIYDRNRHMVSVIDHLDVSLQYFIAVGAGHLSGKYGLISLLRKSGWTLQPIPLILS